MLIFRREAMTGVDTPSPEQFQAMLQQWKDWTNLLAAGGNLVAAGTRLGSDGRVILPNRIVRPGPFMEVREVFNGFMFLRAGSIDGAVELGKGCPILLTGGTVEVRPLLGEDGSH